MDSKLWLLIEWAEDKSTCSNYGIINTNTLRQHETELHDGKVVLVRDKNNGARKAQILRISENKRYLEDFKVMLERRDSQVKSMVSLCMNTLEEMKTGHMWLDPNERRSLSFLNRTRTFSDLVETSTSDSDIEEVHQNLNRNKPVIKYSNCQSKRSDSAGQTSRVLNDKTLTFDQGTQTDPVVTTYHQKLNKLEIAIRRCYSQFETFVANIVPKETNSPQAGTSEEPMDSEANIIAEPQSPNADFEKDNRKKSKTLEVRRESAQTTNTGILTAENDADMVSIGSGNVTIPARLWHNMDWTSHTLVTRQLLQAVFPRRILATHSLTGKPSPAFANKPPKQQLDPKLIDDIVCTVSERCRVPKSIVRKTITSKCTDEAKLNRNRLQQRKHNRNNNKKNPENISPLPSSNESSNSSDES